MSNELSLVKIELLEEYKRCLANISIYQELIQSNCVKGNLSLKKIKGKEHYYLQWSDGGKQHSKYIKPEHVDILKKNILKRENYEKSIKTLNKSLSDIKNFLGQKLIDEYVREIK